MFKCFLLWINGRIYLHDTWESPPQIEAHSQLFSNQLTSGVQSNSRRYNGRSDIAQRFLFVCFFYVADRRLSRCLVGSKGDTHLIYARHIQGRMFFSVMLMTYASYVAVSLLLQLCSLNQLECSMDLQLPLARS